MNIITESDVCVCVCVCVVGDDDLSEKLRRSSHDA